MPSPVKTFKNKLSHLHKEQVHLEGGGYRELPRIYSRPKGGSAQGLVILGTIHALEFDGNM